MTITTGARWALHDLEHALVLVEAMPVPEVEVEPVRASRPTAGPPRLAQHLAQHPGAGLGEPRVIGSRAWVAWRDEQRAGVAAKHPCEVVRPSSSGNRTRA